jgi:hypothetical protein
LLSCDPTPLVVAIANASRVPKQFFVFAASSRIVHADPNDLCHNHDFFIQDVQDAFEVLLGKGLPCAACQLALLCWYTDVHDAVWRYLRSRPEWQDWTADAALMDLLLALIDTPALSTSPFFPDIVSHCLLSVRLSRPRFTSSPQFLVCALASSRMYSAAASVLVQLQCVPAGLRANGGGVGVALLRRFLRDIVRSEGTTGGGGGGLRVVPVEPEVDRQEWRGCCRLAQCALTMLEMDALGAPLADLTAVYRAAPYL